jgi:hypothetical protein
MYSRGHTDKVGPQVTFLVATKQKYKGRIINCVIQNLAHVEGREKAREKEKTEEDKGKERRKEG